MRIRKRRDYDAYEMCAVIDGRRIRRTFETREAAEGELARLRREVAVAGHRVATIPEEVRARWLALDDRCRAVGSSLEEAAEAWLRARPDGGEVIPAAVVLERWLDERRAVRSPQHTAAVAGCFRELLAEIGPDLGIREITRGHLVQWLEGKNWVRGRLANVSSVLGWAVRHGLLEVNPADQVPRPEVSMAEEVRVLSPDEAGRLMRAAWGSGEMDLVVSVVLGMFAGMRQREISSAEAGDIDLDGGEIVVPLGKVTSRLVAGRRSRKRRVITMEPAAQAWLEAAGVRMWDAAEPVRRTNFRKRWEALRCRVFPDGWPANVLRHTYASYHYALFRDEALLQAQMGHDSRDVLHQHYRAVVRRAEAERFWAILPDVIKE